MTSNPTNPNSEVREQVFNLLNDLFEMGYWCGVNSTDDTQPHHVSERTKTIMQLFASERQRLLDAFDEIIVRNPDEEYWPYEQRIKAAVTALREEKL